MVFILLLRADVVADVPIAVRFLQLFSVVWYTNSSANVPTGDTFRQFLVLFQNSYRSSNISIRTYVVQFFNIWPYANYIANIFVRTGVISKLFFFSSVACAYLRYRRWIILIRNFTETITSANQALFIFLCGIISFAERSTFGCPNLCRGFGSFLLLIFLRR